MRQTPAVDAPHITSLDVITTYFDGNLHALGRSSASDLEELADRLRDFYAAWVAPQPMPDEIRFHFNTRSLRGHVPGGLPAASVSYMTRDLDSFLDEGDAAIVEKLGRRFCGGLLYADRVVELDPLSFWMHMYKPREDRNVATWGAAEAWVALRRVEPLLRAGCLVLAPIPTPAETDIVIDATGGRTSVMQTALAAIVAARTASTLVDCPWPEVARSLDNLPTAPASTLDLRVADALAVVDLPFLSNIPVQKLVDIRESEEAFASWRAELRTVTRHLHDAAGGSDFASEAKALFSDTLVPKAAEVRTSLSRSHALRNALREQPIRATLGAAAAGGAAVAAGTSIEAALASAGTAGIAQLLAAVLLKPRPTGSAAVLAKLV